MSRKPRGRGTAVYPRGIYVDPVGLMEAQKSMTSTMRGLDVERVPLRTTLRLMLGQLDLAYVVEDRDLGHHERRKR